MKMGTPAAVTAANTENFFKIALEKSFFSVILGADNKIKGFNMSLFFGKIFNFISFYYYFRGGVCRAMI
jgi:hypothetical protein